MWKRNLFVPVLWLIILIATSGNFFFWDTVQLASKQAHFFYDNNFSSFFLPEHINSGHPPFYGMALAGFWFVFGKSLIASHVFNMLFVLGAIFQAHKLGQWTLGRENAFWIPLVLFCNPIFLGHSILVSPDNALIFFVLLGANGLISGKLWKLALAFLFLALLSMRGMMVVSSFFLFEIILNFWQGRKVRFQILYKYMAAGIAALIFFSAHYLKNEWLGFHNDSPWEESFDIVNIYGYIRNLGIICWRLLDFGNIFVMLTLFYFVIKYKKRIPNFKVYASILLALTIVFVLPLAAFKYLSAHRYFIPLYLLFSMAFAITAIRLKLQKSILAVVLVLLLLGNWWIYPRSISQGWDVSLGHLPFYSLVHTMNETIEEMGLEESQVGTEFPIKADSRFLYLNPNVPSYAEGVIGKDQYIIYSKVINDYKDKDYEKLNKEYNLVKGLNHLFIDLELYEKR